MVRPAIVLQRHDEDLYGLLHQLLSVVGEQQMVVGDPVAHWVVGTHHVEQRGEQRQGVSGRVRRPLAVRRPRGCLILDRSPVLRGAEERHPRVEGIVV